MKAEHRKELETNALAAGAGRFVERVKTGRLGGNVWLIAVVVVGGVVGGVWWYASRQGSIADSKTWAAFVGVMRAPTTSEIDEFTKNNKDTVAAKLARLEQARALLGPEGLGQMRSEEREARAKGVENVEKAREEFTKLADEFKSDPTMRAKALTEAAEAELALVGTPKAAAGTDKRGTVKAAAAFCRQAAQAIGEATPAGEALKKRADDLEARSAEIEQLADVLHLRLNPAPSFTGTGPKADGPKAPDGPIQPPKPPDDAKKDTPKAPDKPLVTPQPPAPAPAPTPSTKK